MGKMTIKKCFKRSQDTKVADYKHKKESFIWPHYERRETRTCSDNWSDLWKEDSEIRFYVYREWTHPS